MNYDCKLQNYPVIFKELLRSKLVTHQDPYMGMLNNEQNV